MTRLSTVPSQIGPYKVLGLLGAGGMGEVYRAQGPQGREVALKVTKRAIARSAAALKREVRTLKALEHPGIVRMLDQGGSEEHLWYAMPLVSGVSLSERFSQMWERAAASTSLTETAPVPSSASYVTPTVLPTHGYSDRSVAANGHQREILDLGCQIGQVLSYLHDNHVVHGDLKPSNVLLHAEGYPVLVDFGITGRIEGGLPRERLVIPRPVVGTIAYLAPERHRDSKFSAAADLYSFGCLLYEGLVGSPPKWTGARDRLGLIPPSRLVSGVAVELDQLICQLLSPDVAERPKSAGAVIAVLESLGGRCSDALAPTEATVGVRAQFVGRAAELSAIEQALDGAEVGEVRSISLVGPSGSGKTRLLTRVAAMGQRRGYHVVGGECEPRYGLSGRASMGGGRLFGPLEGVVSAVVEQLMRGDRRLRHMLLVESVAALGPYFPALTEALGLSVPEASAPGPVALERTVRAMVQLVKAMSLSRPLMIMVDDLQWLDDLSWRVMERLIASPPDFFSGVFVSSLREGPSEPLGRFSQGLSGSVLISVESLSESEMNRLLDAVQARRLPTSDERRVIARRSMGLPYFAVEYLRTILEAEESGYVDPLTLPMDPRDAVRERLARLPRKALQLLQAAAVLGRVFSVRLLRAMNAVSDEEFRPTLRILVLRGMLEERTLGTVWAFVHDVILEQARSGLDEVTRLRLHGNAAALCEQERSPAWMVASHYLNAGRAAEARKWFQEGGEKAWQQGRAAEATWMLHEAEKCIDALGDQADPEDVGRLASLLFEVESLDGMHRSSVERLRWALRRLGEPMPEERWRWLRSLMSDAWSVITLRRVSAASISPKQRLVDELNSQLLTGLAVNRSRDEVIHALARSLRNGVTLRDRLWFGNTLGVLGLGFSLAGIETAAERVLAWASSMTETELLRDEHLVVYQIAALHNLLHCRWDSPQSLTVEAAMASWAPVAGDRRRLLRELYTLLPSVERGDLQTVPDQLSQIIDSARLAGNRMVEIQAVQVGIRVGYFRKDESTVRRRLRELEGLGSGGTDDRQSTVSKIFGAIVSARQGYYHGAYRQAQRIEQELRGLSAPVGIEYHIWLELPELYLTIAEGTVDRELRDNALTWARRHFSRMRVNGWMFKRFRSPSLRYRGWLALQQGKFRSGQSYLQKAVQEALRYDLKPEQLRVRELASRYGVMLLESEAENRRQVERLRRYMGVKGE